MEIIQRILKLDQHNYYVKHLELISCLLPTNLTKKEIEVLAAFMSLDKSITEGDMFNSVARKKVMEILDNMSPGGLGNHLKSMIDKKVLDKDVETKRIRMKDFLKPKSNIQGYQIRIENEIRE